MWLDVLVIIAVLICLIVYFFVIKPYRTIQQIKAQFQAKGYKVLVQKLKFNDDTITSSIEYDVAHHQDALHRYKTTWQDYDVTIKNSFFAIYVSLNSIELVKEAYKKIQFLPKPQMLRNNYSRFYGGGLLIKQGDQWKTKRKLYAEIFNFKLLQQLHPIIENTIEKNMEKWKTNQKIDLLQQFRTMFFNSFVTCYFGRQFDQFSFKDQSYSQTIAIAFEQVLIQAFTLRNMLFGTKFLEKGFFKEDKQIQQRVSAIKQQTKQFVQKRFLEIQKEKQLPDLKRSILSKLVFNDDFINFSNQDRQKAMQSISGDVLIFFFAGTDTTSATLAATIHMLSKHPNVVKKLIEQLDKSLITEKTSKSQTQFTHSTLKQWKYMDAVMNQVLRLYGPFNWIFVRQILENDFTIGGVSLPKDSILGIQTQTIHCSQKYYKNPFQFNPERFMTERNQDPYSFVAFGGGQRNCIGQYLARIEYKIALAKFLRKFTFKTESQLVMYAPSIYLSKNNEFVLQKRNMKFD